MPPTAPERSPGSHSAFAYLGFAATSLLITWGVLAFGAVYQWAYFPLAAGATVLGIVLWKGTTNPYQGLPRPILLALGAAAAGVAFQLIPLPSGARVAISPATDTLLRTIDLTFAAAMVNGTRLTHPLSIDPAATWRALLVLVSLAVLLMGLVPFLGRYGVRTLVAPIVALGVAVAIIGIVQKALLGDGAATGMRIYGVWQPRYLLTTPFGPFVNRNHFAGWMLLVLPFTVACFLGAAEHGLITRRGAWRERLLWLSSPRGGQLQLMALAVLIMGLSLVMSQSRSGVMCVTLAMAAGAMAALRRHRSYTSRLAIVGALTLLLVLSVMWSDVRVMDRFAFRVDDSIRLRQDIWSVTARIIRDFPLTGTGLNTFGTATLAYQVSHLDMHYAEAHNDYLQLAAEGGVLLSAPLLAAVVFTIGIIWRRFDEGGGRSESFWPRLGAVTGLMAVALQSLVDFSLQMPGTAVLFVVFLAMALHRPGSGAAPTS
jgi:O-antigen ligase